MKTLRTALLLIPFTLGVLLAQPTTPTGIELSGQLRLRSELDDRERRKMNRH